MEVSFKYCYLNFCLFQYLTNFSLFSHIQSFIIAPINSVCHNVVEIIKSDKSIIIQICIIEYFLQFLLVQVLSQLLTHFFQLIIAEFSLCYDISTALFRSKTLKTLYIQFLLSFYPIFDFASFRKSAKSIPLDSSSLSLRFQNIGYKNFMKSLSPEFTNATFNYIGSIIQLPSLSKDSKASLISKTYSRDIVVDVQSSGLNCFLDLFSFEQFLSGLIYPFFIITISICIYYNLNKNKKANMEKKRTQKSNDEYRRDIFILKQKLKDQQQYLEELKQKQSEADIFSEESYTFHMKTKILENDFSSVKHKIEKYAQDKYKKFYELNFCVYAFSRACTIVGFKPEMVFRAVDIRADRKIKLIDLANFMRDVLRMESKLFNPILNQLDPQQSAEVQQARFTKLLQCFIIDTEKPVSQDKQKAKLAKNQFEKDYLSEAFDTICYQLLKIDCKPYSIWKADLVNVATTAGGLKEKLKNADNLDCIGVYCRCDPTKQGAIESGKLIKMVESRMSELKNPSISNKKIKLKNE